jgi:ATP-dependent RNA helicase DDX49/DBP8
MAAQKATVEPATIRYSFQQASDASSQSKSESDPSDDSDSDSLDSQASRKRRKISSGPDDDEPSFPSISVPSRMKLRIQNKEEPSNSNHGAVLAAIDPQITFSALNVKPWLVGSLRAMAIKRPTGIQKHCIPEILKGRDCIGGSRTGSGKTVAFAVPILQKWAEDPFGIFALVLTPTR